MDVNFTRSWRGNSSFVFSRFKLESWINVFSANREKKKSVCWAFGASSTLFSSLTSLADTSLIHPLTPGSVCKTGTARLPRCSICFHLTRYTPLCPSSCPRLFYCYFFIDLFIRTGQQVAWNFKHLFRKRQARRGESQPWITNQSWLGSIHAFTSAN